MRESTREPSIIARLYALILPYRRTVTAGMACLLLSIAAELYPPLVWQRVVDVGLAQQDWVYIGWQLGLLVLVFGVGQFFSAVRGVLLERAGQRLTLDLRLRLYRKLQSQSAAYFSQRRTGDLLARLTADVETVQKVLLPIILVGLLLARYNYRVRPVYRAARKRLGDLSALFADNLGGMRVIQSFAQERRMANEAESVGRELYNQQIQAVALRNRVFPAIRWVANLGNVIMLGGGVYFVMRGQFTLGGLLAYRGYGRYFYGPIDDLVNINDLVQQAAAAGRRIFEVLDAPVTIADAPGSQPIAAPLRGDIRFEHVTFGYDPARPVLKDINLHIQPGERVALLGPSGAGKSTLLALVARLYDPDAGRVLIDGRDLRLVTLASLHSQMAQVQQESFLFNTSALENLRYGRPGATRAEVEAAARAANAHGFLSALAEGYDTLVGERGVKLSGGQKQRLAVARALLTNPPLLLLDEPTSAVEPESEALIIEALERLMRGRTTLIVSHRLSLARSADRVVVVTDGRIVENGSPDALLAQPDSHFAAMMQA